MKQSNSKNNNISSNVFHVNPYRVKRTYNTMLEQSQSMPPVFTFSAKRLKQSDSKPPESIIKHNKPKIPEKLLREIERYNWQRYAYNKKVSPCPCDNKDYYS